MTFILNMWVVVVVIATAAIMIPIVWLAVERTRPARRAADEWLDLVAAGNSVDACRTATEGFRTAISPARLAAFARETGLAQRGKVTWWELSASPAYATLAGRFAAGEHAVSLMMVFRPENGVWRLDSVQVGNGVGLRMTREKAPEPGPAGLHITP